MSAADIHLRNAETGALACGAAHRPFSGRPCCKIDVKLVTCEDCKDAAVKEVTDQIPAPHYSWQPEQPPSPAAFTQRHIPLFGAVD